MWEIHFKHRDRLKGLKKIYNINTNYKKSEKAILTLNKDFRGTKNITKNKEGHFIIIRESIIRKICKNFKYAFS